MIAMPSQISRQKTVGTQDSGRTMTIIRSKFEAADQEQLIALFDSLWSWRQSLPMPKFRQPGIKPEK
jgi:hypothetical protein